MKRPTNGIGFISFHFRFCSELQKKKVEEKRNQNSAAAEHGDYIIIPVRMSKVFRGVDAR
jgi:hypothetical protein